MMVTVGALIDALSGLDRDIPVIVDCEMRCDPHPLSNKPVYCDKEYVWLNVNSAVDITTSDNDDALCPACDKYFIELSRYCTEATLGECDCPECQGLCTCEEG